MRQYIVIKVKLCSKYEDKEDALVSTFKELLKYPKDSDVIFPKIRFSFFLKEMTLK